MTAKERVLLGMSAGLVSVISKFLAQDYDYVVAHASNLTPDQLLSYKVGYGILTPALMLMGGFIAWVSEETNRMKIVALAISAPALITTWAGGAKVDNLDKIATIPFVSSAYAQNKIASSKALVEENPNKIEDQGVLNRVQKGIGIFFGYGKEPLRYRVVVGSFKNIDEARSYVDSIKSEAPKLHVWIADKREGNDFYGVIIGEYNYLSKANEIMKKVLTLKTVNEAYLSAEHK